ncbi:hypothetical protein [Streptomyces sp. NPDC050485]
MTDPKVEAINRFFAAYAASDVEGMSAILAATSTRWTPTSGPTSR